MYESCTKNYPSATLSALIEWTESLVAYVTQDPKVYRVQDAAKDETRITKALNELSRVLAEKKR